MNNENNIKLDIPNQYEVGFEFTASNDLVLLIRKNRPEWQKGKLNGIGGHIKVGETPLEAMRREFEEEDNTPSGFIGACTSHVPNSICPLHGAFMATLKGEEK